jgi:hypothetical protein
MIDLQKDLRRVIDEAMGPGGSTHLPIRVRKRARLKQVQSIIVAVAIVGVSAFAVFGVFRALPRSAQRVPANGHKATPIPSVPKGTYGPWPKVVLGKHGPPPIQHEEGEDSYLVTPMTTIAYGTVRAFGSPERLRWSALAFIKKDEGGPSGSSPCIDIEGKTLVGSGACQHEQYPLPPTQNPMVMGGPGIGSDQPDLFSYAAVLTKDVASVTVRLADGTSRDLDIFRGPPGIDANYVFFWPPGGAVGLVVAKDATGHIVSRARLCPPINLTDGGTRCSTGL